ncbi:MAG: Lrp/AsnC family transcriptional regulator [Candidatus Diapherotrites archaeon]|nr:Lrp/AsnC family transcriptional regulator [Candidatus Diapherotrites archaeon]
MVKFDELDLKILNQILEDHSMKYKELAKELNVPETTVYERLRKFKSNNIIQGTTPKLNLQELGYGVTAFILIEIKSGQQLIPLAQELTKHKNITNVYETSGTLNDILVMGKFKEVKQIGELINKLHEDERVDKAFSLIAYTTLKEELNPFPLEKSDF